MIKDIATPVVPINTPTAVAVVLSWTGNHTAETKGGPPIVRGPPRPMKNWPRCINLQIIS